jgi:hypothetical protein
MYRFEEFVAAWLTMAEILSIRDLPDDNSLSKFRLQLRYIGY